MSSPATETRQPTFSGVALNTVLSFINSGMTLVGGIVTSLIIARSLGPNQLGQFSYLIFVANLIVTILTFGLGGTITKFVSEFNGKFGTTAVGVLYRWLQRLAPVAILLVVAGITVTLSVTNVRWHFSPSTILSASILGVFIYLATLWRSFAQGQQSFPTLLRVNIWSSWLGLTAVFFALSLHPTVTTYIWVMALPSAVAFFALARIFRVLHRTDADDREMRGQLRTMRSYLWPVAIVSILDMIVWQYSEVLILGWFRSSAEVAYYAVAFNIASVAITTVASSFDAVFLPTISTLYGLGDHQRIRAASSASLRFLVFLIIPMCALLTVLAPGVIHALYGSAYSAAISITPILIIAAGFGRISGIASSVLYSLHRQKIMLRLMFVIAIINIGLDFFLIPHYGIFGAAIANGSAQIVSTLLSLIAMQTVTGNIGSWGVYFRPLVASLPAAGLAWTIYHFVPNLMGVFLGGILGGYLFVVTARLTGAIRAADRELLEGLRHRLPIWIQRIYQLTLAPILP